jgi:membrane protein YdbS with pleckstrin-like domain
MTGTPTPAVLARESAALELLEGGEAILFAIRPSLWFVPLISRPFIGAATLLALGLHLWGFRIDLAVPPYALAILWTMAVVGRLFVASLQWMGRLYVLTNRRLITVHGLAQFRVRQCPLRMVRSVELSAMPAERLLGLGTLSFTTPEGPSEIGAWPNLARPARVREEIEHARGRCVG